MYERKVFIQECSCDLLLLGRAVKKMYNTCGCAVHFSAQEAFWLGALFVPLPTRAQFPTAVSISCQGQKEQRRDA